MAADAAFWNRIERLRGLFFASAGSYRLQVEYAARKKRKRTSR